jgi:hypothetical protein
VFETGPETEKALKDMARESWEKRKGGKEEEMEEEGGIVI